MTKIYNTGVIEEVFFAAYILTIILAIFISIGLPLNRAVGIIRTITVILSILILSSIAGFIYFLLQNTFYMPVKIPNTESDDPPYIETGETYFNWLLIAGIIMLSSYILPCIMRPIDFFQNIKKYTFGFCCYLVLTPLFNSMFPIYSMCNLHDVSWGNRPTSTGTEAFSAQKKTQEELASDYKVFRTYFVFFWLVANACYYIMIVQFMGADNQKGAVSYLSIYSMVLSGLVAFRVIFATIYILRWKCRYGCKL